MLYCGALCWQNKNQVDMISDNGICMLFDRHAKIGRNNFFWTYGDVHSVSDLRCAIDELFFC